MKKIFLLFSFLLISCAHKDIFKIGECFFSDSSNEELKTYYKITGVNEDGYSVLIYRKNTDNSKFSNDPIKLSYHSMHDEKSRLIRVNCEDIK